MFLFLGMLISVEIAKVELSKIRTDETFHQLLDETCDYIIKYEMTPLKVPRRKQLPLRLDDGGETFHASDISDYFRPMYFELIDTILNQLEERYNVSNNSALKKYKAIENCVLEGQFNVILEAYPEISIIDIEVQLPMFRHTYAYKNLYEAVQVYKEMTSDVRCMFPSVFCLLRLLLVFPVSSCESERSFSCLRRLKTWLRSTMTQERLNHVIIGHVLKH